MTAATVGGGGQGNMSGRCRDGGGRGRGRDGGGRGRGRDSGGRGNVSDTRGRSGGRRATTTQQELQVIIREAAIEIDPIVNEALDRMIAAARSTNSGMPVDGFDGDINQSIAIEMLNHSLIAGSQQQRSAGERIRRPSHRLDV